MARRLIPALEASGWINAGRQYGGPACPRRAPAAHTLLSKLQPDRIIESIRIWVIHGRDLQKKNIQSRFGLGLKDINKKSGEIVCVYPTMEGKSGRIRSDLIQEPDVTC